MISLVGAGRFELPTPCAQGRCATRLRYAPTSSSYLILNRFLKPRNDQSVLTVEIAGAKRWAFPDGRGEVGIIAPVSEPFCGHCNRIRLTADGKIRTCLFSVNEHDLRSRLRNGASDQALAEWLKGVVWHKEPRHHIGEPEFVAPPRSMSCIGG